MITAANVQIASESRLPICAYEYRAQPCVGSNSVYLFEFPNLSACRRIGGGPACICRATL